LLLPPGGAREDRRPPGSEYGKAFAGRKALNS